LVAPRRLRRRTRMNGSVTRKAAAGVLAATLVGGGFALGRAGNPSSGEGRVVVPAKPGNETPPPLVPEPARAAGTRSSFAALVAAVDPAVVHIKVTSVVKTGGDDGFPAN